MFKRVFLTSLTLLASLALANASEPLKISLLKPQPLATPNFTLKVYGTGSCGQFCRTTSGQTWNCDVRQRPVYLDNGGCVCQWFRECN